MHDHNGDDRRIAPREKLDCEVYYIAAGTDRQCAGILDNVSATGALVWVEHELVIGSKMVLSVEPEYPDEPPVFMDVRVVRLLGEQREGRLGYGCEITSCSEDLEP